MQTIVLYLCYIVLILLFSTAYNISLIYCFVRWCLHTSKRRPCSSSTLSGHPSSSFPPPNYFSSSWGTFFGHKSLHLTVSSLEIQVHLLSLRVTEAPGRSQPGTCWINAALVDSPCGNMWKHVETMSPIASEKCSFQAKLTPSDGTRWCKLLQEHSL